MLPALPSSFAEFGACRLAAECCLSATQITLPPARSDARRLIRQLCEPTPGVYGMLDAEGQLIYVGKSKTLRNRLLSYFQGSDAEAKSQRIIARTRQLVWETAPQEFAALLRELELIRRWRPRFNVRGQPRRLQRSFLCVGRGPAAYAYLAAQPSERSQQLFGPLRPRWREAVRRLNDCFGLRDCSERQPIHFLDQGQLFAESYTPGCLRHELGLCLGPCAGGCSRAEYDARVRAACEFLRGEDLSVLERLEAEMYQAAAAQQFERAAALRDTWHELAGLAECLNQLSEARQRFSFVYPLPDYGRGERWYLIDRGQVAAAVRAPRGRRQARRCLELLDQVYRRRENGGPAPRGEDPDALLLVTGWFRQYPDERHRTLTPEQAREFCQVLTQRRGAAEERQMSR